MAQLITVKGKGQQGLVIGDNETNLVVPMEAVISMYAISNILMVGPTFDMLILDSSGSILNPIPTDGSLLKVSMGDSFNDPTTMPFRVVGSPVAAASPRGPAIRISCTYDSPKLFHSICQKSVIGTSSTAVKQIAADCGLRVGNRIDSSVGDSMKWLPMGRKYGYFLSDIAAHGWFGDESAASLVGVTLDGEVCYRDLAKVAKSKPTHAFYYGVDKPDNNDNAFIAHDMQTEDLSSVGIGLQGYSAKRSRFRLDGVLETLGDIKVTQGNERINIGSKMKTAVGISKVVLAAIDCGNTHAYFDQAEHQNSRYRATFGRQVSVVVAQQTSGIDLLDPAVVYYLDPKTREPASTTGIVTAKTRAIVNGFYVERFNIGYQGEDDSTVIS